MRNLRLIKKPTLFTSVHKSVNPTVFGGEARYFLGRYSGTSGAWSLRAKLAEAGVDMSDTRMAELIKRLKEVMEVRRKTLTDEELVEVARDLALR